MGSGAWIYIPSFVKIGLGIQKLIRGYTDTHTHTHTHTDSNVIPSTQFFQNKESRLKSGFGGGGADSVYSLPVHAYTMSCAGA
jgi:hypothetical protein